MRDFIRVKTVATRFVEWSNNKLQDSDSDIKVDTVAKRMFASSGKLVLDILLKFIETPKHLIDEKMAGGLMPLLLGH